MAISQADVDLAQRLFCLPCSLLLNFALFLYLVTVFGKRHRELLVRALLLAAFLSFAHLVPSGHPDDVLVDNLSDVSDAFTVITFLLQIIILTRDINKKVKLVAISRLARIAELLVAVGVAVIVANVVEFVKPQSDGSALELFDDVTKYVSLVFVACFRFYFLVMARGAKRVWHLQKLEMGFYLLLITHAVPFQIIRNSTDLDWYHAQGLWMRLSIALCLSTTVRSKRAGANSHFGASSGSSAGKNQSHGMSVGGLSTGRMSAGRMSAGRMSAGPLPHNLKNNKCTSVVPFPEESAKVHAHTP